LRLFSGAHYRIYCSTVYRAFLEDAGFEAVGLERYKISWLWGLMTAIACKPLRSSLTGQYEGLASLDHGIT
jgi:hypothetical protein